MTMGKKVASLLTLAAMGVGLVVWGNTDSNGMSRLSRNLLNMPSSTQTQHVQTTTNTHTHATVPIHVPHDVLHVSREHVAAPKNVWMVGLMSDASSMTKDTFDFLMEWHCAMGANVHLLVESGAVALSKKRDLYLLLDNQECDSSAAFHVVTQPGDVRLTYPNRIDRLAHLRDVQRDAVRELTSTSNNAVHVDVDAIIVLDGDLHSVPNARFVQDQLHDMLGDGSDDNDGNASSSSSSSFDVVCATGVNHDLNQFAYYDTFATILQPDTWVYPLADRLENVGDAVDAALYDEEDTSLVVDTGITNVGLLQYIQSHATTPLNTNANSNANSVNVLPVKSCFGGLALYRASTWLNPFSSCTYSVNPAAMTPLRAYANKDDERTCEHVTFHQCLQNQDFQDQNNSQDQQVRIALHPLLVTEWHDVAVVFNKQEVSLRALAAGRSLEQDMTNIAESFIVAPMDYANTNTNTTATASNLFVSNNGNSNMTTSMANTTGLVSTNNNGNSANMTTNTNNTDAMEAPPEVVRDEVHCSCNFEMNMLTDYFGYETSYELLEIQTGEVILEGSGLGSTETITSPQDMCLPEGQYIFYVRDSYGDGMFNPGSYSIDVCSGDFVRSGGGSDHRWYVERTVFHVDSDGHAQLPPPPEPFQDGTLVGRTSASACAENMAWGNAAEFAETVEGTNGFICTDCVVNRHTQWMQIFYDLDVELMRILWQFDAPKSLESRFNDAAMTFNGGEHVTWTIMEPNSVINHEREGTWRWSTGSGGWPVTTTGIASGSHGFSNDDGAWGGADGIVNGDGYNDVPVGFWGQGNFNGGDGMCGNYYRDGVAMDLEMNALWSEIYVVTGGDTGGTTVAPAPSPAPTEVPSMAPTGIPACLMEFILKTDGWGGETSWSITRTDGGSTSALEYDGAAAGTYNKNRVYSIAQCLEPGNYEITVMDSGKDGMFPPGGFDLYVGGKHIRSGGGKGGFTEKESVTFDIGNPDGIF
jgi:hypothetical protein